MCSYIIHFYNNHQFYHSYFQKNHKFLLTSVKKYDINEQGASAVSPVGAGLVSPEGAQHDGSYFGEYQAEDYQFTEPLG